MTNTSEREYMGHAGIVNKVGIAAFRIVCPILLRTGLVKSIGYSEGLAGVWGWRDVTD